MKIIFFFALAGGTALSDSNALAQITNTNVLPLTQTLKYQIAFEADQSLGERSLLPPGLKEKMHLTDAQRLELKPIEDDFANTGQLYQVANQPRLDAALEANSHARAGKDPVRILAARKQLQAVWAGLSQDRVIATTKIKPLLTPEQFLILEDQNNQWRENHGSEVNDPSAN
jgi:hypothetical protein